MPRDAPECPLIGRPRLSPSSRPCPGASSYPSASFLATRGIYLVVATPDGVPGQVDDDGRGDHDYGHPDGTDHGALGDERHDQEEEGYGHGRVPEIGVDRVDMLLAPLLVPPGLHGPAEVRALAMVFTW